MFVSISRIFYKFTIFLSVLRLILLFTIVYYSFCIYRDMADAKISFKEFCDVCENIQTSKKIADKEKKLSDFFCKFKNVENDLIGDDSKETTAYSILRLLVPEYERERPPYGLKETSFSKLYVRTLCLHGSDANNLTKYNKINTNKGDNDFADVAYWILRKWCPKTSTLTIADVNTRLDEMAQKHAEHQPREVEKVLSKMIKTSTALEQKWIIRIILKNMRLGLGNDRILKIYHPDAADLFDVCSSLSKVAITLKNKATRLHELEIEVFTPFRPMLSLQCDVAVFNQVFKTEKLYYVENKFDGERFQLHMKDNVFKYFSKNGYEYSNVYGANYANGLVTPLIKNIFDNVESVILDGEMMGWNKKTNNFGSKGMSFDVKTLKNDTVHRPCYCVFDILYLNGEILTNKPLFERVRLLDQLIVPIKGVLQKSHRVEIKTKEDILKELNKSVDRQEEGVCFKDPDSIYKPNNRKGGWWKLKLEYFEGKMTELDLIILGGYYGEGKRKGQISSFLLGVAVKPLNEGETPSEFHTFAKVASGFTIEELDTLLHKMNQFWEPFDKNKTPDFITWKKEKPDCWINPRKSYILQVKASELCRSSDFQTNYTLRFPRVVKIRYDKNWYDCWTTEQLNSLTKNNQAVEKLSGCHLNAGDLVESPPKKRKTKDNLSLDHLSNIDEKSVKFKGKEFCVFTGNEQNTKQNIEIKIRENGGRVVQFSGPNTLCTLVGDITPRAKSLISTSTSDIVKLDWIIKNLNSPSFIKFRPNDMLVTSAKTKVLFSGEYDRFGDSFTQIVNKTKLSNILEEIKNDDCFQVLPHEIQNLDEELSFNNQFALFRNLYIYFDDFKSELLSHKLDFIFYGGKVCDKIENYTSHIVVQSTQNVDFRLPEIKKIIQEVGNEDVKIVTEEWINKCIHSNKIVDVCFKYINI